MLRKFSVENFKPFKERFVLDLSKPSNYEFSKECVEDGVVSKGAIYGINGIGKSNFGAAIFDIVNLLTDKRKELERYEYFLNLDSKKTYATFEYEFQFEGHVLIYSYKKRDVRTLLEESIKIDDKEMLYYDFVSKNGFSNFKGSEKLNLVDDSKVSRAKYISSTSVLEKDDQNNIILSKFKDFVERMLLFYSLRENGFIGFKESSALIDSIIINAGKVEEFEKLLTSHGLNVHVVAVDTPEGKRLYLKYENGMISFFRNPGGASTGMFSLALYFSWLITLEKCSFVIIDEFDAYYHYELAEDIIKKLKQFKGVQIFVTTHNTDLLSNDLLRPDSYFVLTDKKIDSLNRLTDKDLRFAHNLQKMFKGGAFKE